MALFRWFIVRRLAHDRLRTGVTAVSVALGVAVVIAIRLANTSSVRGFEAAIDAVSGRTTLEIRGVAGIPEPVLADLGWVREFGRVSPVIEGEARVLVGDQGETVRVLGVDILRDRPFREYRLLDLAREGEPTAADILSLLLEPDAIVLTERFARRHGLEVGAEVVSEIGGRRRRLVLSGLLRHVGPARLLDGNFALMDIAAAQLALDRLGLVDRLEIQLATDVAIDRAQSDIGARLPDGLSVQRPSRRGRQVERMLEAFHFNLAALSYVALLVGLFLVYNTIAVSVITRREEIGMLRALGVPRAGVVALFLGEALVFAVVGCALGVLLGRLFAIGAIQMTSATVSTLYVRAAATVPEVGPRLVALAFLVGVPLSLAAAAAPALEASRVSPMAAIRGSDRLAHRWRAPRRLAVVAVALFGAAWWLAGRGPVGGLPIFGLAAALCVVFGAACLVPSLLYALARLVRRPLTRVLRVEGRLAHANLAGSIPRVAISVAALAVSLAMMAAVAIMIGSFRETVIYWVGQTLQADLYVVAGRGANLEALPPIPRAVERAVVSHPAVAAVDRFRRLSVDYGERRLVLGAGDFAVLLEHGNLLFKAPADGRAAMQGAIGREAVVVSEPFALRHGVSVDDVIDLPTPSGPRPFHVSAIYYDYSNDQGTVVMDRATMRRHFTEARPSNLAVYLAPGADAEAVRSTLLAEIGSDHRVFINTNAALRQEVLRVFDSTFAITYALEAIAIFVAMMGVAGTLMTLILERRLEFGTLRLIGADRHQLRRMVVAEATLLGAVSQGLGLVVGLGLSLILIYVINVQSFGWTIQFHVPAFFLAQSSLLTLVATAASGLYPARWASRLPALEQREAS